MQLAWIGRGVRERGGEGADTVEEGVEGIAVLREVSLFCTGGAAGSG